MFMLIVLFDVIYCLIVTHKLSQIYPKTKEATELIFSLLRKPFKKWSPMPGANS